MVAVGSALAEELLDAAVIRDILALELRFDGLDLTVDRVAFEKRFVEEPSLHVKGFLQRAVIDLKLVVSIFILRESIAIPTIRRYMIGEAILFWILLAAHEDHMLEEMRQTLSMARVIIAAYVHSKRTVCHNAAVSRVFWGVVWGFWRWLG